MLYLLVVVKMDGKVAMMNDRVGMHELAGQFNEGTRMIGADWS